MLNRTTINYQEILLKKFLECMAQKKTLRIFKIYWVIFAETFFEFKTSFII